jgi:regulator of replication initiation timing
MASSWLDSSVFLVEDDSIGDDVDTFLGLNSKENDKSESKNFNIFQPENNVSLDSSQNMISAHLNTSNVDELWEPRKRSRTSDASTTQQHSASIELIRIKREVEEERLLRKQDQANYSDQISALSASLSKAQRQAKFLMEEEECTRLENREKARRMLTEQHALQAKVSDLEARLSNTLAESELHIATLQDKTRTGQSKAYDEVIQAYKEEISALRGDLECARADQWRQADAEAECRRVQLQLRVAQVTNCRLCRMCRE